MAVVETITNSIIPEGSMFTDRGINVTFTNTTVQLGFGNAKNIVIGCKSKENKLWRINLMTLFQATDSTSSSGRRNTRR
jgi:hypothetical protein